MATSIAVAPAKMRFRVGDKVRYTSGKHGDREADPVWGGVFGYQVGEVEKIEHDTTIHVRWANKKKNLYQQADLESVIGGIAPTDG